MRGWIDMLSMSLSPQPGERTLILVADGSRANGFEVESVNRKPPPTGSGGEPTNTQAPTLIPVKGMDMKAASLDEYDLNRKGPAQVSLSASPFAPTAGGNKRDETMEQIKHDFAKTVADTVNTSIEKNEFQHLIVIASPAMLGQIRSNLSKRASSLMVASHAADLTHFKGPELLKRINHIVRGE